MQLRNTAIRYSFIMIGILFLSVLTACSSREKKEYADMPDVVSKINVKPIWVAPTGERSEFAYRQLPITTRGNEIFVDNAKGDVGVIDIPSGKLKWSVSLKERLSSGPGVGQGYIAVATNDAEIIAIDDQKGTLRWRSALSSVVLAQPVIVKDKVFVQSIDEKVYALDLKTGKRLWVEGREVPALTLRGTTSPIVIGDLFITGFASGALIAFRVGDGKIMWEASIAVPSGRTDLERMVDIDGLFVADNNVLYVASYQGKISAVSLTDGTIIWNREMSTYQGMSLADEQLYITDVDGLVWAIDKKTGATLWRQSDLQNRDVSAPVVMEQGVVVADGGGYVHWLSKEDGGFIARQNLKTVHAEAFFDWGEEDRTTLDYGVTVIPVTTDHKLLVRNDNGDLALFNVDKTQPAIESASWYSPLINVFKD